MNQYEVLYLITPELDEEANRAVMDKFAGIITGNGGEIVKQDEWGKRKLAYAIDYPSTRPRTCPRNWSVTSETMSAFCATWLPGRKHNPESSQARTEQQHERICKRGIA